MFAFSLAGLDQSVSRAWFPLQSGVLELWLRALQASIESCSISTDAAVEALDFFLCLRFMVLLLDGYLGQMPSTTSQQEGQICNRGCTLCCMKLHDLVLKLCCISQRDFGDVTLLA